MKFGGTSVADRAAIGRLISIVRAARQAAIQPESSDWRGPIVVVSALGGATDRLLGIAAEAGAGDIDGARDHVRALRARHHELAGIITDEAERREVDAFIDREFDDLDRIVGALGVLRDVTPRWLDAMAALGEITSSRIVAAALTSHGLAASWVDARQDGRDDRRSHPGGAALAGHDGRARGDGRSAAGDAPHSRRRRLRRRDARGRDDDARAGRVGLFSGDRRRRRWARRRSRSGPTSTAC